MAARGSHSISERHPSVYCDNETCSPLIVRCGRNDCGAEKCNGEMYHCPLCPPEKFSKEIPSRVKEHFKSVHWENRIHEFEGFDILRCKLSCTFASKRHGSDVKHFKDVSHYHCFGCNSGFKRRNEAIRHIRSAHDLQLSVVEFGWKQQQCSQSQLSPHKVAQQQVPQNLPFEQQMHQTQFPQVQQHQLEHQVTTQHLTQLQTQQQQEQFYICGYLRKHTNKAAQT
ncbi:uncharacterized protein LOC124438744 [Xenia sp. Carnegie-2017]|uniref:uncharacterized protein LOC124438744 n=1 Tax=Xenia sp. Carnegie-2017 TaxID=2897299 RepID=UPI001F036BFA|nr:uncharacterized protein LOC124438744 [Xenia sp. Carnegie-2017]